jgi:hypothetical protein
MFRHYSMTLNRVHDTVVIREGDEKLKLFVDADPMRMTAGLVQAQQTMQKWTDKTPAKTQREYALLFAGVIFGEEQAKQLLADAGIDMDGTATANHWRITPMGIAKPAWLTLKENYRLDSLEQAVLVDARNEEATLVESLGALCGRAYADCREGMSHRSEERRLLGQGA